MMQMPSMPTEQPPWTDDDEETPELPRYARLWKADLWEAYRQIYTAPSAADSGVYAALDRTGGRSVKAAIGAGIRLALTVGAFILLARSISWNTLLDALGRLEPGPIVAAVILGAFAIGFSTLQWRSLLHGERIWVGFGQLFKLYLVGMAFNHFLPTGMGGDAVKAIYVGRASSNSEGSVSAVLMARVTGLIGMLAIAFAVLAVFHAGFAPDITLSFLALSAVVIGGLLLAILASAMLPRLFPRRRRPGGILAWPMRIASAVMRTVKRPRAMTAAIVFGLGFWAIACLNYWIYGAALQIQVPFYFYFVVIPLVSLLTFLPISINGYGVRESALALFFTSYHVAPATTLVLALLMDAQVLLYGAIGGLIYLTMDSRVGARVPAVRRI